MCAAEDANAYERYLSNGSGILGEFSAKNSQLEQVDFVHSFLKDRDFLPPLVRIRKDDALSLKFRKEGNECFKRRDYEDALQFYTKSAFYAEDQSEHLAISFANRSAVLFEANCFHEALIDIANAESSNYPKNLNEKLAARKSKVEASCSKQELISYHDELPKIPENARSKCIECAANCLQISENAEFGRHVIATKRINTGDVLAIERPFAATLLKEHYLTHCYNCLKFTYNLIPCRGCVHVGFCSETCRESSWNSWHKYECLIIDRLIQAQFHKLVLIALKIVLITRGATGENLQENVYKSQSYSEICQLITNHELREPKELFRRCVVVASIYDLMKNHTDLFDVEDEGRFKKMLLKHFEAASSNFHEISEFVLGSSETNQEIGVGAYSFLSLLNHSCSPNVVRHCYGQSIVLRALKPIEKDEQILDNYGYHHAVMEKRDRLAQLKSQYLFDCSCIACSDNWPLYDPNSSEISEVDIANDVTTSLLGGCRETALKELPNILKLSAQLDMGKPTKTALEIQEYLKQCFSILGNKRCLLSS